MIAELLGSPVAAAEAFGDDPAATLFPDEQAIIAKAPQRRQREFATARGCARAALARLGQPPAAILPDRSGAPQWPAGVTGSITHCRGYRAAAVALTRHAVSLGVDAEPNQALRDAGMLDIIARDDERARLAELAATVPGVCWDRLLFCAKEAVYKAWYPLARCWLDFESADVVIGAQDGTFTARLLVPGPPVAGPPLTGLRGRWLASRGLLLAAVVVPALPGRAGLSAR
jgi:4'-phosphopantetheinyl transferase EntD